MAQQARIAVAIMVAEAALVGLVVMAGISIAPVALQHGGLALAAVMVPVRAGYMGVARDVNFFMASAVLA
jgi:hypothetical protein